MTTKDRSHSPRRVGAQPSKAPSRTPRPLSQEETDRLLDEELAESFPASDPPSILRGRPD